MLKKYKTVFVQDLPNYEDIEKNTIYFSESKNLSTHSCPCGCGEEVYLSHYKGGWSCYIDKDNQINITTRIENKNCDTYYTVHSGYAFSEISE